MKALLQAPLSFATTLRLSRPGRARFERRQKGAMKRWLKRAVPRVEAFSSASPNLCALPIMDKATLMANFASYNRHGVTADEVRAAMTRDYRIGALTVGASTGTSGNRGLFVISEAERFRWLGAILAKAMPDLLWQKQRVAIVLPQGTGLYDSANRIRQISLRFFDLNRGNWFEELENFAPTVLVAPPKVLRHLVEEGADIHPVRVFSAAETLDPVDRPIIEAGLGPLGQIYMATEGLLGVTCRHNRLHLAEDSVFFEFESVGDGLVSPLISSFRRETQILARYRMNDLLRLDPTPCLCGSPLRSVTEIIGRMDDCFRMTGPNGKELITPDILRNAVLSSDPQITDFRLVQTAPEAITLTFLPDLPTQAVQAAKAKLEKLLTHRGLRVQVKAVQAPLPLDTTRKLRRVECRIT